MSTVKQFVKKDDIHMQACEWISRIDRGLSDGEQQEMQEWVEASRTHRQQLFEVAELWDDLSALNELKCLFPLKGHDMPSRKTYSDATRWAVAACVGLFMAGALLVTALPHLRDTRVSPVAQFPTVSETLVGEQKPVTLSDGSVIHLNTDSKVRITYSDKARLITLERGEAHFVVAHDTNRPFVVTAGDNTVTAVGTAFNVELKQSDQFDVLVTEGKVLVKQAISYQSSPTITASSFFNGEGKYLVAGQKGEFRGMKVDASELSLDQVQKDLAWQQGMLVFQGESLSEALTEVSRYTPVKFDIPDSQIRQVRVAGYFKAGDIDGLLVALENNFDIRSDKIDGDTIRLTGKP